MWSKAPLLALICAWPAMAQDAPQSAIDWLTEGLDSPAPLIEPAVTQGIASEAITAQPLDAPRRDGVGVLAPQVTGLPATTFSKSDPQRLIALLGGLRANPLPALQELAYVLLLAEADPPATTGTPDAFLAARIDRLIAYGALEQADALLQRSSPDTPALFKRWFDVSLLTGNDDAACAQMRATPAIAPSIPARIYCLSRGGDWAAAALTLETGRVVGAISAQDADLLARFLDPEVFEGEPSPLPPAQMTPLRFRLLEGLGEPPVTTALPVAYAVSDLRDTIGWKSQLEAAERLARRQAIGPSQLRALYTERMPAASGGVWDRAEAFQRFEVALQSGDPGAIANALPGAWAAMSQAGLQTAFAELFADSMQDLPLAPAAKALAVKIGLLSKSYETVAQSSPRPSLPRDAFAIGLAKGTPPAPTGLGPIAQAIFAGFQSKSAPEQFAAMLAEGRLGEALLQAISNLDSGAVSDPGDISDTIALLRAVGLQDIARRAGLQLLLMEQRQ